MDILGKFWKWDSFELETSVYLDKKYVTPVSMSWEAESLFWELKVQIAFKLSVINQNHALHRSTPSVHFVET